MAEQSQSAHFLPTLTGFGRLMTLLWWVMLLSCVGVSIYATQYLVTTPSDSHFSRYIVPLRLHIAGGMGALLAGPWQFSETLRARALNLHRSAHRNWMIRNFALSLAAVTLRIYLPLMLLLLHWSFRQAYITVSWLCWIPNLLVAEWLVRQRFLPMKRRRVVNAQARLGGEELSDND